MGSSRLWFRNLESFNKPDMFARFGTEKIHT